MRKIPIITGLIFVFAGVCLAADGFKEGNKLYLDGKYNDALIQYQQFIQKNPGQYERYFNAGNALYRQEQYDAALGMYKKAQEINPKDPDIQYNMELTQKKLDKNQEKKQCDNPQDKDNKQDKQGQKQAQKQAQQNRQNKNQQGQKNETGKGQEQKQGQQAESASAEASSDKQAASGERQAPSGMTEDEVQALLNRKQNQEKQLQGYFGKQYQKQGQEPDMFNMSPMEMMMYMQKKMMDPNYEPPQKGGSGNEKDW